MSSTQASGQASSLLKPPSPSQTLAVSPSQKIVSAGQGGSPVVPSLVELVSVVEALTAPVLALVEAVGSVVVVVEFGPVVGSLLASLTGPTEVGLVVPGSLVGAVVAGSVAEVGPAEVDVVAASVAGPSGAVPASPQASAGMVSRARSGEEQRRSDVMMRLYHVHRAARPRSGAA